MPIRLSIIISSFFIVFSGCVTTPTEQPTTSEPSITEITACETANHFVEVDPNCEFIRER